MLMFKSCIFAHCWVRAYADNFTKIHQDQAEVYEFQNECLTDIVNSQERVERVEIVDFSVQPCPSAEAEVGAGKAFTRKITGIRVTAVSDMIQMTEVIEVNKVKPIIEVVNVPPSLLINNQFSEEKELARNKILIFFCLSSQ